RPGTGQVTRAPGPRTGPGVARPLAVGRVLAPGRGAVRRPVRVLGPEFVARPVPAAVVTHAASPPTSVARVAPGVCSPGSLADPAGTEQDQPRCRRAEQRIHRPGREREAQP